MRNRTAVIARRVRFCARKKWAAGRMLGRPVDKMKKEKEKEKEGVGKKTEIIRELCLDI